MMPPHFRQLAYALLGLEPTDTWERYLARLVLIGILVVGGFSLLSGRTLLGLSAFVVWGLLHRLRPWGGVENG